MHQREIRGFFRLFAVLSAIVAVVSPFSPSLSSIRHSNQSPTITMATPQRLLDSFEASGEDPQKDFRSGGDASDDVCLPCTPSKAAPTNDNEDQTVTAHESPIGKHLPRPMRMVDIITTSKRQGYLGWDDYFLGIAVLSSQRSKDPDHSEGACIADAANRIVAIGYSGFPRGCPDTIFPWNDFSEDNDDENTKEGSTAKWLHSKRPYVCDAATNAVLNKGSQDLTGCRLYVTSFPTSDCVKVMIQSGIKELILLQKDETVPGYGQNAVSDCDSSDFMSTLSTTGTEDELAGGVMLALADIKVRYYRPPIPSVMLDFDTPVASSSSSGSVVPDQEEVDAAKILKEETEYDALSIGLGNNGRAEKFLSWDDYFMSVALLTAKRSKDPSTQVGACIVDDQRRIVGLGYNGMPRGLSDDEMPWAKKNENPLFNKYKYVVHAEVNAILNSKASYSSHVNGGTIYVSLFPCENCMKMIIQSGIKKIVYLKDIYHDTDGCRASRAMMRCANIEVQQYHPTQSHTDVIFYDDEESTPN